MSPKNLQCDMPLLTGRPPQPGRVGSRESPKGFDDVGRRPHSDEAAHDWLTLEPATNPFSPAVRTGARRRPVRGVHRW